MPMMMRVIGIVLGNLFCNGLKNFWKISGAKLNTGIVPSQKAAMKTREYTGPVADIERIKTDHSKPHGRSTLALPPK